MLIGDGAYEEMIPTSSQILSKLALERIILVICTCFEESIRILIESSHIFGRNVYANAFLRIRNYASARLTKSVCKGVNYVMYMLTRMIKIVCKGVDYVIVCLPYRSCDKNSSSAKERSEMETLCFRILVDMFNL